MSAPVIEVLSNDKVFEVIVYGSLIVLKKCVGVAQTVACLGLHSSVLQLSCQLQRFPDKQAEKLLQNTVFVYYNTVLLCPKKPSLGTHKSTKKASFFRLCFERRTSINSCYCWTKEMPNMLTCILSVASHAFFLSMYGLCLTCNAQLLFQIPPKRCRRSPGCSRPVSLLNGHQTP